MTEQEGAKPQLSLVPVPEQVQTYPEMIAETIKVLQARKLAGETPDVRDALRFLDEKQDNTTIREWLAANGLMTRSAFDRALRQVANDRRIQDELGFVPTDARDLVQRYAERERMTLTARGTIRRSRTVKVGDETIHAGNADQCRDTRLILDVANASGADLETLGRELRLLVDRLGLPYRDSVIGDALAAWQDDVSDQLRRDAVLTIQYERGRATGPTGTAMWQAMERACFDVSGTAPGFATAVIQKFIWQVKRKLRGLPVTNHLMPVLTGAQGKGKTQFVKALISPLADFAQEVDFQTISDGKTTDIWKAPVLFVDEMGGFNKADVDVIKNVITSTERTIRIMRTNHTAVVANRATLIGCSNRSLGQLMRDDTGGRRFAELLWRNDPDWGASNAIDWTLLWQSVDEDAPDPMSSAVMVDHLREQQEANRNQSPVEIWAREYAHTVKSWTKASDLHREYREWERDAFPGASTSQNWFGRTLTNLVNTLPDFPLEKQTGKQGVTYRSAI